MYDVEITKKGLVYQDANKKIYGKVSVKILLYNGESVSILSGNLQTNPVSGDVSKNILAKYTVNGTEVPGTYYWQGSFNIELHDSADGVDSGWDVSDVRTFIGSKTYPITVKVEKDGEIVSPGPGSGTITKDDDIDVE